MKRYGTEAYGKKLTDYVARVKKAGGKPVVLSSVTRRNFDEQGKIKPSIFSGRTLPEYSQAARAVAKATKVPFIDLNAISIKHHNQIGPKASAAYNFKETDRTHFSKAGAKAIAEIVLKELKTTVPDLAEQLK